jgi:hypothetical protein
MLIQARSGSREGEVSDDCLILTVVLVVVFVMLLDMRASLLLLPLLSLTIKAAAMKIMLVAAKNISRRLQALPN